MNDQPLIPPAPAPGSLAAPEPVQRVEGQVISPPPAPPPVSIHHLPRWRLALAIAVAGVSDAISVVTSIAEPIQIVVDLTTAILLFILLGWQWIMLPALIAEAIPGLSMLPLWTAVVVSLALWGKIHKK